MKNTFCCLILTCLWASSFQLIAQVYPPDEQLIFHALPNLPKPAYLNPITDPTFGTDVTRISDQAVFNTHHNGLWTSHHYAKTQAWNVDGTLIKLAGWPSALLDGETYEFIKTVWPPGGHHTWSNTQPNIIYGTNNPNYDGNCIAQLNVTTNTQSLVRCFSEYSFVSHGEYEGNMSNDDRYMVLQCEKPNGAFEIAIYDFVTDTKIATMAASLFPNNVSMTQSGQYVIVQWGGSDGSGPNQGTWLYNTSDLSPVRSISTRKGSHFDYGYDSQGNEVAVGTLGNTRRIQMIRLDNGAVTNLLGESKMGWPIHVSCRNTDRPGWAYISDFEASYGEPNKPYYQKIFAVKLDPTANDNAVTETFAHTHHSTVVNYDRSTFGTPNRNGTKVMFRSDWEGNSSSEINSYVAEMPGNDSCNLSCTITQTVAPSCGGSNGQAVANPSGGTAPYSYQWSHGQTNQTATFLVSGGYSVTITDANNCMTVCSITISGANSPTCSASQVTAPSCGNNNGVASVTAQGGTGPYSYVWSPSGQTSATANGLSAGTYTVVVTDANSCTSTCTVSLINNNGNGGAGAFSNVATQNTVTWNAGAASANRPKPALHVWEPGDIPGTEIMRVSDQDVHGLHYYNSRQAWNLDMTKLMIGNGVVADNKLLDATNNYALLPTRIPLNSNRVWSNTNPDLIYGIQNNSNFSVFNVSTGVNTILYSRPGGSTIGTRSKGNLPGDDSKIALYESSTKRIISYDIQSNSIIAEIVWPDGITGGGYVSYDWSGNWIIVGMGDGSGRLYRMKPDLTEITEIYNEVRHFDMAYNTDGESVLVHTGYDGSVRVVNIDDTNKTYLSPRFSGADPNTGSWTATPDYISGRGQIGAPGWVAFGGEPSIGSPNHPLGLYKVDGNASTAVIKVIGYDHHSSAPAESNYGNDDRQKPSLSPDGNQLIFTSDWGVPNGPISSYIIRGIGGGSQPCTITCSASQTVAPVCGSNSGQATVSASGGSIPYSYAWSNGQTSQTVVGLSAGSYTVTVTDANNISSVCSVSLTDPGSPVCSISETTAPSCGASNGVATVLAQGGSQPYTYSWSNAQTTATANGLSGGTYSVTITDANNCSSVCSITLTDSSDLSCTIEETVAPSPGGSNGVATVMPSGGTLTTGDPRTDLLASPDRIGYGAGATGGTNYVYVSTFNELKSAMQTAGNYVLLDPSVAGTGIGFTSRISVASNTTLDGSLAPGSWLYPNYGAGYPANTPLFNHFSTTNMIIHSIEMRGERVMPYNASHPSANAGAVNLRGSNVWYDHVTLRDFWGGVMVAQGGNNVTFSNIKMVDMGNGIWLYYPNDTPRYVSLFNSEINADQLTPYNEGASHFHMWNNYIHGARWGAAMTGLAENGGVGQNGPVRTLSENNVFSTNKPYAEQGLASGENYGGPVQIPGYVYSSGALYKNGDTTNGNVLSGNAPWTIPYSYVTMPANQVEAYVATNAGKLTSSGGGGNTSYSYLWNDAAQQTTAVATGLSAGTYMVTVTDGANCSTVCSITFSSDCAVNYTNSHKLIGTQSSNADFETDGEIESSQLITNNSVVDYDSGISIRLEENFEVIKGAVFHAFIDGCGGLK